MKRKFTSALAAAVVLLSVVAVGCKKDAEIDTVMTELDTFTNELVKRVESNPDKSAGVDDAQKFLDSKKAEMTAKVDSIKSVRGYQVSEETTKRMQESMTKNVMGVAGMQIKFMGTSMRDPAFKAKLDKLIADYQGLFKM